MVVGLVPACFCFVAADCVFVVPDDFAAGDFLESLSLDVLGHEDWLYGVVLVQ